LIVKFSKAKLSSLPWDRETIAFLLRRVRQILCWAAVAWVGAALLLGYSVYFYPRQTLTVDSGDVRADAIVVLGGGRDERPQRAAELFKQGAAPRILISGFGDSEADVQLLEKNGVPATIIFQENDSVSTYENAKFSIPLLRQMGAHSAIIVTAWFHSRRALTCFKHFAPNIQFYSRPSYLTYQPTISNRQDVNNYVRSEDIKLLVYWVWHGVWPFYLT
jgi:uncharacterized SAM-binding protein YcdF (DUF218 family)